MKVVVLNGSPKGDNSITLQTMLFMEKLNKKCEFIYHNVGAKIRALEMDAGKVWEDLESADLIVFSYPVYTFIVPSQLHRFVELMQEAQAEGRLNLRGKFVTQVATSKHFYDITAFRFIEENVLDLGMRYIKGLSADMEDLTSKKGQRQAAEFFRYVRWCVKKGYHEGYSRDLMEIPEVTKKEAEKPLVIVTDCQKDNVRLKGMIHAFVQMCPYPVRIVNIRERKILGGCLGCFGCASTGVCIYKDEYQEMLEMEIHSGCGVVYAFTIQNHSMGALFKKYDDRQFCNGHRTVTMGTPNGYLVDGDISKEPNLKMILEARAEVGGNFLAGIAGDDMGQIQMLADTFAYALDRSYTPPANFFGVGGMKIFRDLIYQMQGIMRADHKFFKAHGQYDFPQNNKAKIAMMYLVGAMMSSETIKKKAGNKMTEGMLMPYKNVLDKLK